MTALPRRNKAISRNEVHPSLALQVPSPGCPEPLQNCRQEVQGMNPTRAPMCTGPADCLEEPSRRRVALGQRAGNKGWGARPQPLAQPPALRSRTPASGRASLATQSQGSAAPFIPAGTGGCAPRDPDSRGTGGVGDPVARRYGIQRSVVPRSPTREHLCAPHGPR